MDAIAEIRASKPLAKYANRILELVRPHIRFTLRKGKRADMNLGVSRLGGEPDLPAGTEWPIGPGIDGDAPMSFIAQVDLDAVAKRDVDGVLPKSGVLAFFVSENYDGTVIYGEHDAVVRMPAPVRGGKKKTKKAAPPPKCAGIEVTADMVLPPPWTQFVSSKNRGTSSNARTGKTGKSKTLVELPAEAHTAYCEIYRRWIGGHDQHGMLGYERQMEGVQQPGELVLLRIDYHQHSNFDFAEAETIYWLISEDALIARKFDEVEVFVGSQI